MYEGLHVQNISDWWIGHKEDVTPRREGVTHKNCMKIKFWTTEDEHFAHKKKHIWITVHKKKF